MKLPILRRLAPAARRPGRGALPAKPFRAAAVTLVVMAGVHGSFLSQASAASYGAYTLEESKAWNAKPAPTHPHDLSGVWWATRYTRDFRQLDGTLPPLTDYGAARAKYRLDMLEKGTPVADASSQCYPLGVPRIMTTPYPLQIFQTPEFVFIFLEYSHVVRLVHLDGKPPSANTKASFSGYSVGHWEGDTLVIRTSHLSPEGTIDQTSLGHGPKLVVTERLTKFKDEFGGDNIRDEMTIDDPDYYSRPWTTQRFFNWRSDIRLMEYSCEENNRNKPVDGVTRIQ